LPAVMATGFVAQQLGRLLQRRQVRWSFALAVILFGLWTIWGGGHGAHQHDHHQSMEEGVDHSTMDHSAMDHSLRDHSAMDHGQKFDKDFVRKQTDAHQHHSVSSVDNSH